MKASIIVFPGSNCDRDVAVAIEVTTGTKPEMVWHQSKKLPKCDIIIIPGVAFDRHGGRIGYGKGFYDKFLPQTKAYRLALAFDFQVLEKIPLEKHDESVHGILTESGIFMIDN